MVRAFILFLGVTLLACASKPAAGPPQTVVLGHVDGVDTTEWAGMSLGAAGDINHDGSPDFAISGLSVSVGGRISIVFGPFGDELKSVGSDLQVTGENQFNNAGENVAQAGGCDIDGDGNDDVIVGAPFGDRNNVATVSVSSGDNAGRVQVLYGGPSLSGRVSLSRADDVFVGEAAYDVLGKGVVCLGDLDGDGKDDFALGAPRAGPHREGRVYVFYGRARGGYGQSPVGVEHADAILTGLAPYDSTGAFLARAGDLDGDGHQDLAIGAPDADLGGKDSGSVYVVYGAAARLSGAVDLTKATLLRGQAGQRAGAWLAAAGDFTGAGQQGLLVGTNPVSAAATSAGASFIVTGFAPRPASLDLAQAITLSGTPGDAAGRSLVSLGDLNGDGRTDLVVGAPFAQGQQPRAGAAFLVTGRAASAGTTINLASEFTILTGDASLDYLGETVANVGDVNGDGVADLAVAARGASPGAAHAGRVTVISGKALGGF